MIYCRVEKVNLRTKSGIVKIGSVLLCMGGVSILAFYKGPQLHIVHHHRDDRQHKDHFSYNNKWILGSLLLFLSTTMWSLWLVLQVIFNITFFVCLLLQDAIIEYLWWSFFFLSNENSLSYLKVTLQS